jgi:membrane protein DedA with SNARE-associated domain
VAPSETAAIVAGLLCAVGELSLGPTLAAAALGAFVGDNASYLIGRYVGSPIQKRFFAGERGERALDWAQRMLRERGAYMIVVARFVPGGRTAVTFTAGLVRFTWLRFGPFDALAAICWATYAVVLGYVGGRALEEHPWVALGIALAIAAGITLIVEGIRHLRARRSTT